MILQPVDGRLHPEDCAVILMDYQPRYASSIGSADGDNLIDNAVNLAKIARVFNIPTLLTTIGASSFGGPIFSRLQEIFPDQRPIDRTTLSLFEDSTVLAAVERIGRRKLVVAGLWTDFGVAPSVEQARHLGFEVFMVADACGDLSLRAHHIALQRLLQRGVSPMTWLQMLLALHHDWAPPEAYEALLKIARDHASTHGLEIQYAPLALSKEEMNGIHGTLKERGRGEWSLVPS